MNQARAKVPLVLLLFLVLELTVLDRLRVFGAGPDIMLLLAVVAGIVGGPRVGALFGFAAGIILDLFLQTPMGLSALVFCLVGYGVGNIQGGVLRAAWWIPIVTTLVASVGGVPATCWSWPPSSGSSTQWWRRSPSVWCAGRSPAPRGRTSR